MIWGELPVAVIGAGPVGLAAAAHLIARGLPVKVYEAGASVAANVRDWGHVRLFSPWRYNTDPEARALLLRHGWQEPPGDVFPTGGDLYDAYLKPLAETPEMSDVIETATTVRAISRHGIDKVVTKGRETMPFVLSLSSRDGGVRREAARAVIDASGTWTTPNPLGAGGIPADGEAEHAGKIAYGLPDVLGRDRALYEGRATLVVGAGHSAANVLIDLVRLCERNSRTAVVWAVRGTNLVRIYGGGLADQLPARGELGAHVKDLVDAGKVALATGFSATAVRSAGEQVVLEGETAEGLRRLGPADRIVVATGQRPDLSLTRELRVELDPWLESARALGPMIDPNLHSCGSVPPHGHRELSHPEPGFYTVGMKSYGRAPTFLMMTGYEQVRSVAAAIAGDLQAAEDLRLVLPETGVCTTQFNRADGATPSACCGGSAPKNVDACCVADAEAKAVAGQGCGCGSPANPSIRIPEPA
jgi:thioredoxin reductase